MSKEEYVCICDLSVTHGRLEEFETKIYRREDNYFVQIHSKGDKDVFDIIKETEDFIIISESYDYLNLYVVFLDKVNKTFKEFYLKNSSEDTIPTKGTFFIQYN